MIANRFTISANLRRCATLIERVRDKLDAMSFASERADLTSVAYSLRKIAGLLCPR